MKKSELKYLLKLAIARAEESDWHASKLHETSINRRIEVHKLRTELNEAQQELKTERLKHFLGDSKE